MPSGSAPGSFPVTPKGKGRESLWSPQSDIRLPSVKFDNIEVLTGAKNYDDWCDEMELIFDEMGIKEIVIDGQQCPETATAEEKAIYNKMRQSALLILVQVLSISIFRTVAKKREPHAIWQHLRQQYYRDTAFSLVRLFEGFYTDAFSYNPYTFSLSQFIEQFETNWERIYSMVHSRSDNSSTSYRRTLASHYGNETFKRDQLLCFLSHHHENVIDNLTTKDSLTFADAKLRLLALDKSEGASSSSAFKEQYKDKKTTPVPTTDTTTSCNYYRFGYKRNVVYRSCESSLDNLYSYPYR